VDIRLISIQALLGGRVARGHTAVAEREPSIVTAIG